MRNENPTEAEAVEELCSLFTGYFNRTVRVEDFGKSDIGIGNFALVIDGGTLEVATAPNKPRESIWPRGETAFEAAQKLLKEVVVPQNAPPRRLILSDHRAGTEEEFDPMRLPENTL